MIAQQKSLAILSTLVVLLSAATPAVAALSPRPTEALQEPSSVQRFSLGLDEALPSAVAILEPEETGDATESEGARPVRVLDNRAQLPHLGQGAAWDARRSLQQVENQAAPKKRRLGRWLKKHWYVPTLAGVLVGALVIDDGDDDSQGEDD